MRATTPTIRAALLVMVALGLCAANAQSAGQSGKVGHNSNMAEVIFAEDFEGGTLGGWKFTYSTNGEQSGTINPPGSWSSEIVTNALEGTYSARLVASSTRHGGASGPWNVKAAVSRSIGLGKRLTVRLKFDDIQGSGGVGSSWFQIAVFSADDSSYRISYGFSTTGDLAGDIKFAVNPGDQIDFAADLAEDYLAKYGTEIPDDLVLSLCAFADYAEGTAAARTTDVRLDLISVTGIVQTCPEADLNGDCVVNFYDLEIMGMFWLQDKALADIEPIGGDDIVNFRDFSHLAQQWDVTGTGIDLAEGLNLVSIPLTADSYLSGLLASIEGSYGAVFLYEPNAANGDWQSFVPERPGFLNGFSRIEQSQGFWIDMLQTDRLIVNGMVGTVVDYAIRKGWNLISYPSLTPENIDELLAGVADSIDIVYEYDAHDSGEKWKFYDTQNVDGSTLASMRPGFGYCVHANQDDLWRFDGASYRKQLADLSVTDVQTEPFYPEILQGHTTDSVFVRVAIHNAGNRAAKNVKVKIFDDFEGAQTLLTYPAIAFAEIGAHSTVNTTTINPQLSTFDFEGGTHELIVQVDPNNEIPEEDESNNELTASVDVVGALDVTINMTNPRPGTNPSTEVPIKLNFASSVTGGIPPYRYLWSQETDASPAFSATKNASFVFSRPGNHVVELRVTDSREASWGSSINFAVANSSLLNPEPNFKVEIPDLRFVPGSNSRVEIDVRASNTIDVIAPFVRCTVTVFSTADPSQFSRVIHDDVISPLWTIPHDFTVTTGDLPDGAYTAEATINIHTAVAETDLFLNRATQSFNITGSPVGPPFVVDVSVEPNEPMANTTLKLQVTVANNSPRDRPVKALFSYLPYDPLGQTDPVSIPKPASANLKVGEPKTFGIIWRLPIQPETTIFAKVVGLFDEDTILATGSKFLTFTPFDFEVTDLQLEPVGTIDSPITTVSPVQMRANVRNLSRASGDIGYEVIAGSLSNVVATGTLYGIGPGEELEISYQYRPESSSSSHPFGFHLVPLASDPWSMLDSWHINNRVMTDPHPEVYDVRGAGLKDVNVPARMFPRMISAGSWWELRQPAAYNRSSPISVYVFNNHPLGDTRTYLLAIDVEYQQWNNSAITKTDNLLLNSVPDLPAGPYAGRTFSTSWIPSQTGWHKIIMTCGNTSFEKEVFVQPQVHVGNPLGGVLHRDGRSDDDWEWTDEEYYIPWEDRTARGFNRLRLWTLARSSTADDHKDSNIRGWVYRNIRLDDGTGKLNEYTVALIPIDGHAGVVDRFRNTTLDAKAHYEVSGWMGVTQSDDPDKDKNPARLYEGGTPPLRSMIFGTGFDPMEWVIWFYSSPLCGWWGCDAAAAGFEWLTCGDNYLFFSDHRLRDIVLKNSQIYKYYISLDASVDAEKEWSFDPMSAWAEVDFYNHSGPKWCAESLSGETGLPIRGIWIADVGVFVTSVEFKP